jgi:hypothetical protein
MTPKKGQPPKPPERKREIEKKLRYSPEELVIVEEAYRLSESPRPFLRWLANITLDEAREIIESTKK